jgi:hypothetical protein
LSTDWAPPTTFALHRIPDPRAQQYWDPDHVVSKKLAADRRPPQPEEECCERSGVLWDLAAVYPKGAVWNDRMPVAVLFNGPVVDVKSDLESAIIPSPRRASLHGLPRDGWLIRPAASRLYTDLFPPRRSGETGRRAGLKIP